MQRELNELTPVLAAKTVDTQRLLVQVGAMRCLASAPFGHTSCCAVVH